MENIRPDQPSPIRGPLSGGSSSHQTRWSAAGAHLGGRLINAEANMLSGITSTKEDSKAQKYADTAIEICELLAELHNLWQQNPPDINGAIKQTYEKLENLYKTSPNVFNGSFSVGEKTFTLKSFLDTLFSNITYYDKGDFEELWSQGIQGMPPTIAAIVAILQYKGSDMKMDLYGNSHGAENFFRICQIMAEVATTPESAVYDTEFWGWSADMGTFSDIFPDMLMVYLYDKHIKNDTPEEWAKFRSEYDQIVGQLPKPGANTPNYGKAYNKLQEWKEDQDSWESWDELPVRYSRDFIQNDIAFPAWKDWRKT